MSEESPPSSRPPDAGTTGAGAASAIAVPLVALGLLATAVWFGSRPPAPTPAGPRPTASAGPVDPLPSWNDGPAKRALVDFVAAVCREGGPNFVPAAERVAVFDHDGTLACERPALDALFLLDRVRDLAARKPELAAEEPYAALLSGGTGFVARLGRRFVADITAAALEGTADEELRRQARGFVASARHPLFDVPLAETTYEPMKELVSLLRDRGFTVWLSGSGNAHLLRAVAGWYGIAPEYVVATASPALLVEQAAGAGASRLDLTIGPTPAEALDGPRKPAAFAAAAGRRPIFVAGSAGSGGDVELLRWSQGGGPSFQLVVVHDDGQREEAYAEPSGATLAAARRHGWQLVRMADDWKRVFSRPLERRANAAAAADAATASTPTRRTDRPADPSTELPTDSSTEPSANPPAANPAAVPAAAPAEVPVAPEPPAAVTSAPAGSAPTDWPTELAAYAELERTAPPQPHGVCLLGSSNIRLWTTLAEDFPGMTVVNRGVAGCRLDELAEHAPRLVAAARPRVVVVAAGTNDVAAGATAASIRESFERLVTAVRRDHPDATLVFLAISPTVKRWDQFPRQHEANAAIQAAIDELARDGDLVYLDANAAFLGPDGLPAAECFLDDMQHPSTIGNARRADLIRPVIRSILDAR